MQTPSWKREPARAILSRPCPVRDGRALPKQPPDRAPDVSPSDAPIRVATSRTRVRFRVLLAPGERLRARPSPRRLASRGFTGQGPRGLSPSRRLSSRLLANESFAPTRSARTPPVASSLRCWLEASAAAASSLEVGRIRAHHANPLTRASADDPLSRGRLAGLRDELASSSRAIHSRGRAGVRAASHAPPRRGARSAAPEVPSVDGYPFRGRLFRPSTTRGGR